MLARALFAQAGGGGTGGTGPGGGTVFNPPTTGTGVITPPTGIGTIGGTTGGTSTSTPTIIAVQGVLTGDSAQAAVVIPGQAAAAPGSTTGGTTASTATYQWSITGGKITSSTTAQTVTFVADTAGAMILSVHVAANSTTYDLTATVTVISPDTAGTITSPASATTSAASVTASVPAATDGDRTFIWSVSGDAAITAGQRTEAITLKPGTPGLKEITCAVTLQRLVTVNVRSFLLVTGDGPSVNVTVKSGSGGGAWPGGSRVDILADPPPVGQVFDKWTGTATDLAVLGTATIAPSLAHAVITVPSAAVSLTATYKAAPAWTPATVANFNPKTTTNAAGTTNTITTTLAYYVPANPTGLVFLLHDTGGRILDWFAQPEQILLVRDLVAAGYGIAALNSVNRNTGAWAAAAALENNFDALNHVAALDKLVTDKAIAPTTPVFFLGMSDGGDTGARFADLLATATPARPVKGAVLFCAAGNETLSVVSKVPQFFVLAANDENLGATGNNTARTNSQLMAGRGLATAVASNAASPVFANRFLALAATGTAFTTTDATAVQTALKTAGLLDTNSYVKSLPASADALKTSLPAAYQARAADILAELAVAYGAQQLYADADARIVNFLNSRVANAAAPAPGRLINLSTRTVVSFAGDSFALGFNIGGGAEKATLLIRGVGPALADFGLATAIPALHLDVNPAGSQTPLASNEAWDKPAAGGATVAQITAAAASVGAFALKPGSADTALLLTLAPGTYTVNLKGLNGTTGDVLAEVYDVSKNSTRLTNLSTLASIGNAGDLLIPGIVVAAGTPGSTNPRTLMVRAVGPGLAVFGLTDYLGDPRITVLSGTQTVATNNNWAQGGANGQQATLTAAFPAVGAFPLKTTDADAALVTALAPANYTLQAGAAPIVNNPNTTTTAPSQTGRVLVEVYEVP